MHIIQKLDRNAYRNMCEYNRINHRHVLLLTDRRTESTYPTDRSLQRSIASPPRCSVCSQSIAASSRALGQLCLAETAVLPSLFLHSTNNLSHAALLLTKGGSVCNRRSDAEIETRIFLEYRPSSAITRDLPKFRMIFSHIGTPQISKKYRKTLG